MSDLKTIEQYEKNSDEFISRYSSIKPGRLYELMGTFFHRKLKTLDIGCASGRDLSYMKGSGFDVEGLDTVESFVEHCKEHLPNIKVHLDSLPHLKKIKDNKYENILLSAILMHLPSHELIEAVVNILRVLNQMEESSLALETLENRPQTTI